MQGNSPLPLFTPLPGGHAPKRPTCDFLKQNSLLKMPREGRNDCSLFLFQITFLFKTHTPGPKCIYIQLSDIYLTLKEIVPDKWDVFALSCVCVCCIILFLMIRSCFAVEKEKRKKHCQWKQKSGVNPSSSLFPHILYNCKAHFQNLTPHLLSTATTLIQDQPLLTWILQQPPTASPCFHSYNSFSA